MSSEKQGRVYLNSFSSQLLIRMHYIWSFRKYHNIDNAEIFVNFVFQSRRDHQFCKNSFLMCN